MPNLKARKCLDRRDSLNAEQSTDDNLAFLENETRSALLLKGLKPFLYEDEWARSFRGSGKSIFVEMARCWKCYFLPEHNTNDVALALENRRMTASAANEALSCGGLVQFYLFGGSKSYSKPCRGTEEI